MCSLLVGLLLKCLAVLRKWKTENESLPPGSPLSIALSASPVCVALWIVENGVPGRSRVPLRRADKIMLIFAGVGDALAKSANF